jgi:hypothetical protein
MEVLLKIRNQADVIEALELVQKGEIKVPATIKELDGLSTERHGGYGGWKGRWKSSPKF